jgi:glycosyltransferase involved in cell wall biosynthesis
MMHKKQPTFSAIMINYNQAPDLPAAMDAAFGQTVAFDEVIIVDDGSTDNSVEVIESRLASEPNGRLIKNSENIGIIPTTNAGLNVATGDFIYFMSTGDQYSKRVVEWCSEVLDKHPDVAMVSGNVKIYNSDTQKERKFVLPFKQEIASYKADDILSITKKRAFTFLGGANFIRRDAIVAAGQILPPLKWHSDWFLYLLVASRHSFAIMPQECIVILQSEGQYSHACNDWSQQKKVIRAFVELLQSDYSDAYQFFKEGAFMPTYDFSALPFLLLDKKLRDYLTPLLVWRLLTYKPMRVIGRLLPDDLRSKIRKLVRV